MPESVYVCQGGCGGFEEDVSKMHARGLIEEKFYCEKCIGEIDRYLDARDNLHTRLAVEWADGLSKVKEDFATKGRRLPDG